MAASEFEKFFEFTPMGGNLAHLDRTAVRTVLDNIQFQINRARARVKQVNARVHRYELQELQKRLTQGERLAREQKLL